MFKKIPLVMFATVFFMSQAQAQVADKPYKLWFSLGGALNVFEAAGVDDSTFQFQPEAGLSYYFSPNVGFFTGLSYTKYELDFGVGTGDMTYLDIPFGASFRYANRFMANANSMINLGLYFGMPLSDFESSGFGSADAETAVGLYFGSMTTFPVSQTLEFGFGSTLKYAFSELIEDADTQALSISLNLVLLY
jgi:hypothetical protein